MLQTWRNLNIFTEVTLRPHIVNPLRVAARGHKLSMIVDAIASGLNDHILTLKFHLPTHSEIISKMHHGDFIAKADLKHGFLLLPIRQYERTFLGFSNPITNSYCVFTRLPFGLGSTFTSCIKQCLKVVLGIDVDV